MSRKIATMENESGTLSPNKNLGINVRKGKRADEEYSTRKILGAVVVDD